MLFGWASQNIHVGDFTRRADAQLTNSQCTRKSVRLVIGYDKIYAFLTQIGAFHGIYTSFSR